MADTNEFRHEDDKKLDEMLDSMLASYSAAGPRPGLETRILAQVREQGEKQNHGWNVRWLWAVAGVASATIVLILISMSRPRSQPAPSQLAVSPHQQQVMPTQTQQEAPLQTKKRPEMPAIARLQPRVPPDGHRMVTVKEPATREVAVVKQEVFPSPSPLSEQEKLLFRYLARTPKEELIAQSRPDPSNDDTDEDAIEPRLQNLIQLPQRNSNTR